MFGYWRNKVSKKIIYAKWMHTVEKHTHTARYATMDNDVHLSRIKCTEECETEWYRN